MTTYDTGPGAALCLTCVRVAWHIPAIKTALDLSLVEFTLVKIALPQIYLLRLYPPSTPKTPADLTTRGQGHVRLQIRHSGIGPVVPVE